MILIARKALAIFIAISASLKFGRSGITGGVLSSSDRYPTMPTAMYKNHIVEKALNIT